MKKVLFWAIIVIVFCIVGCKIIDPVPEEAETKGNISGRVTADNGIAVADAAIELVGYGQNRTTGTTGQYAFYDLESGSYQLKISKKNYDEKTVDVVVKGGSTTTKNITLISSYGTISGTVTDAITKEKLSGVKVSISGKTTITTDANGYYEFTNLSSGSFTISFSLDGYQDDDLNVEVTAGSITQGNIQLSKSSIAVNLTALNFGLAETQKSFILTGEANQNKSYTISCDANWINISNEDKTGNVSKTNPKTIMVNVDRSYLSGGNNSTTISILSDGIVLHKIAVTISKGYIKLITPNGNDNLVLKNSTTISWETNLSTSTTIALYKAGTFIENIQSNISDKSITWSIKSTYSAGSDYKIRVTNGSVYDESDANFTLSELPILGLSEESLDFGYDKTSKSLTLTNTGTGSLNWQLTEDIGWLSINGDISGSLMAGESKTIEIVVNRVGKASGYSDSKNLQISYNGNIKNIPVSMSVTAESPKTSLSISPTSYNFGEVIVGNESSEQTFTLTNTGNVAISAVNVALENTENFSISEGSGTQSLPIGASHIIKVKFKPQTATTTNKTTNLLASTSEADNVQAVLSGMAKEVSTSILEIKSGSSIISSLDFGNVDVGLNTTKTLIISNTGNTALKITGISLGDNAFVPSWTSKTIEAGGSESLIITFTPAEKTYSAVNFSITSNKTSGNNIISLSGKGVTRVIAIDSSELNFGSIFIGTEGKESSFNITNSGTDDLSISSIDFPSGFNAVTSLSYPFSIPKGASKNIRVLFKPTNSLSYNSSIKIYSNGTNVQQNSVAVKGVGIEKINKLDLSTTSINFGSIYADTESDKAFTITNVGNSTVAITNIEFPDGFSTTSSSSFELVANETKSISVKFKPSSLGNKSGKIRIVSDEATGEKELNVSGTGYIKYELEIERDYTSTTTKVEINVHIHGSEESGWEVRGYFGYNGNTFREIKNSGDDDILVVYNTSSFNEVKAELYDPSGKKRLTLGWFYTSDCDGKSKVNTITSW